MSRAAGPAGGAVHLDPRATGRVIAAAQEVGRHLSTLADGMQAATKAFPLGTQSWEGPAAQAVSALLGAEPERFRAVAEACAGAAAALSGHAGRLEPALWLQQQAAGSPPELAAELGRRAVRLADDSARQAAGTLIALARSAPAPKNRLHRWLGRLEAWRGEVQLGAAESTEQLLDTALQVAVRVDTPYDPRNLADLKTAGSTLLDGVQHPGELARGLIDWDTWRTNPARAVGHLLPDLALALASGGTASGGRAGEIIRRGRIAGQQAAARDALRRQVTGAAAGTSRRALVRRALTAADHPGTTAWHGEGGTTLTGPQSASVEAFHALNSAQEPAVTAALEQVSRTAESQLAGLEHRLKEVDSLKRKLATESADTGRPLPTLLAEAHDMVRYSVVIDDARYVSAVPQLAAQLERRGFHLLLPPRNAWYSGRYRGINTRWQDPAGGAAFEVQFHTPASWRITKETHPMYEESRLPITPPEQVARLRARIAEAYRAAPPPLGVESLDEASLLPAGVPEPITPPADYTVHATIVGGLAAPLLELELPPGHREPAR